VSLGLVAPPVGSALGFVPSPLGALPMAPPTRPPPLPPAHLSSPLGPLVVADDETGSEPMATPEQGGGSGNTDVLRHAVAMESDDESSGPEPEDEGDADPSVAWR